MRWLNNMNEMCIRDRGYKVREILFKAKGRNNGEWVEGYYVLCRKCHYILPIFNSVALYHGCLLYTSRCA